MTEIERQFDELRGLKARTAHISATLSFAIFVFTVNRIIFFETFTNDDFNNLVDKKRVVSTLSTHFVLMMILAAVFLISLFLAIRFAGVYESNGKVRLNRFDRIFPEIRIIAIVVLVAITLVCEDAFYEFLSSGETLKRMLKFIAMDHKITQELITKTEYAGASIAYKTTFKPEWFPGFISALGLALCIFSVIYIFMSLAKNIKNNNLFEKSLFGKLCIAIYRVETSHDVSLKLVFFVIIFTFITTIFSGWFAILWIGISIFVIPRKFNDYDKIREGIKEIKNGNFDNKIQIFHKGEFARLAEDINDIAKAEKIALNNELRSQRLRNELISNVSHDIKTPLTSMVTYVDLLKMQGLDSPDAMSYLNIIEQKTKRLQKLSGDLFEAAKASSGAIPITIEVVDLNGVAKQALGELNDLLDSCDITAYFESDNEHNFVRADGKMLWRVIENLLTNVSKYSLPGTRAYIKAREMGKYCVLEISNVSRDQLNMDPDELMERFKRGDRSRNTEGSGLGLAIARDLMHVMDGDVRLNIDGDLFKARIFVPRVGQL